jgi:hypothetical protein
MVGREGGEVFGIIPMTHYLREVERQEKERQERRKRAAGHANSAGTSVGGFGGPAGPLSTMRPSPPVSAGSSPQGRGWSSLPSGEKAKMWQEALAAQQYAAVILKPGDKGLEDAVTEFSSKRFGPQGARPAGVGRYLNGILGLGGLEAVPDNPAEQLAERLSRLPIIERDRDPQFRQLKDAVWKVAILREAFRRNQGVRGPFRAPFMLALSDIPFEMTTGADGFPRARPKTGGLSISEYEARRTIEGYKRARKEAGKGLMGKFNAVIDYPGRLLGALWVLADQGTDLPGPVLAQLKKMPVSQVMGSLPPGGFVGATHPETMRALGEMKGFAPAATRAGAGLAEPGNVALMLATGGLGGLTGLFGRGAQAALAEGNLVRAAQLVNAAKGANVASRSTSGLFALQGAKGALDALGRFGEDPWGAMTEASINGLFAYGGVKHAAGGSAAKPMDVLKQVADGRLARMPDYVSRRLEQVMEVKPGTITGDPAAQQALARRLVASVKAGSGQAAGREAAGGTTPLASRAAKPPSLDVLSGRDGRRAEYLGVDENGNHVVAWEHSHGEQILTPEQYARAFGADAEFSRRAGKDYSLESGRYGEQPLLHLWVEYRKSGPEVAGKRPGTVFVNGPALQAVIDVMGKEGKVWGYTMAPKSARQGAKVLREMEVFNGRPLSEAERTNLNGLAHALETAAENNTSVRLVKPKQASREVKRAYRHQTGHEYPYEIDFGETRRTMEEEHVHQGQRLYRRAPWESAVGPSLGGLARRKAYGPAEQILRAQGYEGDPAQFVEEIAAKIASGQKIRHQKMELPDALAKEWFREYVRLLVKRHGVDGAKEVFRRSRREITNPAIENAKKRLGIASTDEANGSVGIASSSTGGSSALARVLLAQQEAPAWLRT